MCPTLVIGGECDRIVGVDASIEIVERITSSEEYIYTQFGHAAYEEAKDFNGRILKLFSK